MIEGDILKHRLSRRGLLLGGAGLVLAACDAATRGQAESDPAEIPGVTSPTWLMDHFDDPELRLIDLSALPGYRAGHIPGAIHAWWQDTIEIHNPVYGMLLNHDGRAELVSDLGITPESLVICYDDAGGTYASRLIWMLGFMGFANAQLLNGGLAGWKAAGGEVTLQKPDSPPSGGIEDIQNEFINAHAPDILQRLDEPGLVILDTRTDGERRETWRGVLKEGKIPGSHHLPRSRFLQDGDVPWLAPPDELRTRLAEAGIDIAATAEVIVYGLHATLASLPYIALETLDEFHVRLYDGSWAEWGSNPGLPIEPL